jgi:hypothetical protein
VADEDGNIVSAWRDVEVGADATIVQHRWRILGAQLRKKALADGATVPILVVSIDCRIVGVDAIERPCGTSMGRHALFADHAQALAKAIRASLNE